MKTAEEEKLEPWSELDVVIWKKERYVGFVRRESDNMEHFAIIITKPTYLSFFLLPTNTYCLLPYYHI